MIYNIRLYAWRYVSSRFYTYASTFASSRLPDSFIYFPLSYLNEGEHIFTNNSIQDCTLLRNIVKDVPRSNLSIVVKEHRAMLGERRASDFAFLNLTKLIKYISPYHPYFKNPISLIKKSNGVVVVNGTTGIESILLSKPVYIFGAPLYFQYFQSLDYNQGSYEQFISDPTSFIIEDQYVLGYLSTVFSQDLTVDYSLLLNPSSGDDSVLSPFFNRLQSLI